MEEYQREFALLQRKYEELEQRIELVQKRAAEDTSQSGHHREKQSRTQARFNPADQLAIQNTLSRYCEALDTKVFDLLDKVFVADATANYPFNPHLNGVDDIRNAIFNRLGPIRTHHSLTTQTIVFGQDGETANTATHFIGVHLGQGPHEGKELKAYGRYIDEVVCIGGDDDGVPGASGQWRIKRRTVLFTGRVGDENIMHEY